MRALVTGGAGFIGSRLRTVLLDAGHDVLVVDDLRTGHPEPEVADVLTVVTDSLGTDAAANAIRRFAPTVVFHLAAIHYIPYAEAHPDETREVNLDGAAWLIETCSELPLDAFVACSTAAVYGFSDDRLTEDSPLNVHGIYGETKVALEGMLRRFAAARPELTVGAARLFNVYGPGNLTPHVMPILLEQIYRDDVLQVGNTWPTRDYVHVNDVAAALIELSRGPAGFVAYNVGTGVGTTVAELITLLAELADRPGRYEVDPARERTDDDHPVGDPSRIQAETEAWRAQVTLREGAGWLVQDAAGRRRAGRIDHGGTGAMTSTTWEHSQVDILGVRVSVADMPMLLQYMDDAVEQREQLAITFANPNYIMAARHDSELRGLMNEFDLNLADGWGIVLAARLNGKPLPTRMANDDVTDGIFGLPAHRGWRVFLFGSAPGVAETAGHNLAEWYPGLDIVGTEHGYWDVERGHPGKFDPEDVDHIVEKINAAKPDMLHVGVPTPLQQRFVIENRDRLEVPIIMTGGSYLDHLALRRHWYPPWVLKLRVGWLYRLCQDPKRLWHRYSVELADYLFQVLRQRRPA